ncbi:MAG: hypothetical protein AAF235_07235 [Planctomycetota bacterium]
MLTWLGNRELEQSVAAPAEFWEVAENLATDAERRTVLGYDTTTAEDPVFGVVAFYDAEAVAWDDQMLTLPAFHEEAMKRSQGATAAPVIFYPVATLTGDPFAQRRDAQRALVDLSILKPLVEISRDRMGQVETWNETATTALAELLRLQAAADGNGEVFKLDPLFRHVFSPDFPSLRGERRGIQEEKLAEYLDTPGDNEKLQAALDYAYGAGGGDWPPAGVTGVDDSSTRRQLRDNVESFVAFWSQSSSSESNLLGRVTSLVDAVRAYQSAESALILVREFGSTTTVGDHESAVRTWRERYQLLAASKAEVDRLTGLLAAELSMGEIELERAVRASVLEDANARYATLLAALDGVRLGSAGSDEDDADADADEPPATGLLADLKGTLTTGQARLAEGVQAEVELRLRELNAFRSAYIDRPGGAGAGDRAYAARFAMYDTVNTAIDEPVETPDLDRTKTAIENIEQTFGRYSTAVQNARQQDVASGDLAGRAAVVAEEAIQSSLKKARHDIIEGVLEGLAAGRGFEALVREDADRRGPAPHPVIPLTVGMSSAGSFESRYQPGAASDLLSAYGAIGERLSDTAGDAVLSRDTLRAELTTLNDRAADYIRDFVSYWTRSVPDMVAIERPGGWPDFRSRVAAMRPRDVNEGLEELSRKILEALEAAPIDQMRSELNLGVEANTVQTARGRLETSVARLTESRFDDRTVSTQGEWVQLAQDAKLARRTIIDLDPATFRDRYLSMYEPEDGLAPADLYWSDFGFAGLRAVADSTGGEADKAWQFLTRDARRFPLAIDANPANPMSAAELERAAEAIDLLAAGGGSGAQASTGAGGGPIRDGNTVGLSGAVQEQIRRLLGESISGNASNKAWLSDLARVVNAFDGGIEWELAWIGSNFQKLNQGGGQNRFMEVWRNGQKVNVQGTTRFDDNNVVIRTGVRLRLPLSAQIEFRFFEGAGPNAAQVGVHTLATPWGGLEALEDAEN